LEEVRIALNTITYCSINLKRQMEAKIEEIKGEILNSP
jgi:hypothetical protein